MARLHEHQGKALLKRVGIEVPRGVVARTAADAEAAAKAIGGRVVLKIQAWTTNRRALGGVAIVDDPAAAGREAARMLGMKVGNFPVEEVLVEEAIAIRDELFVSLFVDDRERGPGMLLSLAGGSGIEARAAEAVGGMGAVRRISCDVKSGPSEADVRGLLEGSRIGREYHAGILSAVRGVFAAARANEARSVEINPLVTTADGRVMAADCRVTVDDYAVFRHPELGIEIARELDHPPTTLEKIAYSVEQTDHRGTFYFAQLNTAAGEGAKGLIAFHGAGGGGSMMSMDAITNEGFTIANFCDTSGNPSSAKVYRAARIILRQEGVVGYFGSGSGVASQEQFWSAYGLAKAFWELELDIPAVIRLGGNTEDRAVEILESACKVLAGRVEGYRKSDPPAKIARRFAELVSEAGGRTWKPREPRRPVFVGSDRAWSFAIKGGRVWIDRQAWASNGAAIVSRSAGLLANGEGGPVLTVSDAAFATKDSEMIACEVECRRDGVEGLFVELMIPGLDDVTSDGPHPKGGR